MRCRTHGHAFTLYPPGYVPYGRQRLAPVAPDGGRLHTEGVRGAARFAATWFGPALAAGDGDVWPHDFQQPCPLSPSEHWYSTQARRIDAAVRLLGLLPTLTVDARAQRAELLAVETVLLHELSRRVGAGSGLAARGKAVAAVLAAVPTTATVFDRLAEAGYQAGLWARPWRWHPRSRVLRPCPFRPVGTRARPPPV